MLTCNTNVDVPNNRTAKQMKQKLAERKGEMDIFIIIFEDFNTSLSQ